MEDDEEVQEDADVLVAGDISKCLIFVLQVQHRTPQNLPMVVIQSLIYFDDDEWPLIVFEWRDFLI